MVELAKFDVEALDNSQLRSILAYYGLNNANIPVSGGTRSVLIPKLRKYLNEHKITLDQDFIQSLPTNPVPKSPQKSMASDQGPFGSNKIHSPIFGTESKTIGSKRSGSFRYDDSSNQNLSQSNDDSIDSYLKKVFKTPQNTVKSSTPTTTPTNQSETKKKRDHPTPHPSQNKSQSSPILTYSQARQRLNPTQSAPVSARSTILLVLRYALVLMLFSTIIATVYYFIVDSETSFWKNKKARDSDIFDKL